MDNKTKISIQMRETGEIVREDIVNDSDVDGHLMFLDYYWGMDQEASVNKTDMWVDFYLPNLQGRADIFFLPA